MSILESKTLVFALFLLLFLSTGFYILHWSLITVIFLLSLFFIRKFDWERLSYFKLELVLWAVFLSSLLVSTVSTVSFPASFEELLVVVTTCTAFFVGITIPKKGLKVSDLLHLFHLLLLILASISLVNYVINTTIQSHVSLTNFYYGHNHLASLLILGLPTTFYFGFLEKSKKYRLLFYFLFVSLLLSMGRVAIFIGLLQVVGLFLFSTKPNNKGANWFVLFSFFMATVFLFFTSFPNYLPENVCQFDSKFRLSICKDISSEGRVLYWKQAVKGLQDSVLTGTGPGTFFITNEKYRQALHLDVNYVHNAYLKYYSELGIFGGTAFVVLVMSILYKLLTYLRKQNNQQLTYISIGIISFFIYIFFDFDLSIKSVQLFIFFYLGLVLSRYIPKLSKRDENTQSLRFVIVSLITITIVVSLMYSLSLVFTKFISQNKLFLFNSQKVYYFENNSLTDLENTFYNDVDLYVYFLNRVENLEQKKYISERIYELSPFQYLQLYAIHISPLYENTERNVQTLEHLYSLVNKTEAVSGEYYFDLRKELSKELSAKNHLSANQVLFLSKLYPWGLNKVDFAKYENDLDLCPLHFEISEATGEQLGEQRVQFAQNLLKCSMYCQTFSENFCKTQEISTRLEYLTRYDTSELLRMVTKEVQKINISYFTSEDILFKQFIFLNELIVNLKAKSDYRLSEYETKKVAESFVLVGNSLFKKNVTQSVELYKIALTYQEDILLNTQSSMSSLTYSDLPSIDSYSYITAISEESPFLIAFRKKENIQIFQQVALDLIAQGEQEKAVKTLEAMKLLEPLEILSQSQLGNYYLLTGQFNLAEQEYKKCLVNIKEDAYICDAGMGYASDKVAVNLFETIANQILSDSFISEN